MLSGDMDCWKLLLTSSRHLLLTVFRVSGGGAVLVVCVLLVCSWGILSCCCMCECEHVGLCLSAACLGGGWACDCVIILYILKVRWLVLIHAI